MQIKAIWKKWGVTKTHPVIRLEEENGDPVTIFLEEEDGAWGFDTNRWVKGPSGQEFPPPVVEEWEFFDPDPGGSWSRYWRAIPTE